MKNNLILFLFLTLLLQTSIKGACQEVSKEDRLEWWLDARLE